MGNQVSELDAMAGQGKIVLSYGDCLLRESDLRLLDKGGWINDKIIGFAFEWVFYIIFCIYDFVIS